MATSEVATIDELVRNNADLQKQLIETQASFNKIKEKAKKLKSKYYRLDSGLALYSKIIISWVRLS